MIDLSDLDDLIDNLAMLAGEKRFSDLESELRSVDIPNTDFGVLVVGYLGTLLTVSDEELPYVQKFRDSVVDNLKTRPEYHTSLGTPIFIARLSTYSPQAKEAQRFLNSHGIRTHMAP